MKLIDKLVMITKNEKINLILIMFWCISIITIILSDSYLEKHYANKIVIVIASLMLLVLLTYGTIFVMIRILTKKEENGN